MRIGVFTLLWKRHEIASFVLNHYSNLELNGIELVLHAVGSEGNESRKIAEDAGWNYTEHPNQPFTDKWNCATEFFKDKDVDACVMIGSNDLVNDAYFYVLKDVLSDGIDSIRLGGLVMLETKTGRSVYFGSDTCGREIMIGSGKAWNREILEKVKYKLFVPGLHRSSDLATETLTYPYQKRYVITGNPFNFGVCHIDIKSPTNLHSFDLISESLKTVPFDIEEIKKYYKNGKEIIDFIKK